MIDLSCFVGLPYAERGCWELVRLVYREAFGIRLPDYRARYDEIAEDDRQRLGELILRESVAWTPVPAGDEETGDVVLFRILRQPSHIGIVVSPGRFLHVLSHAHTSCIESYRGPKWRQRVDGFYRHA